MTLMRIVGIAMLLLAIGAGTSTAGAAPPGSSSEPVTGRVALGPQAVWLNPITIIAEVDWECSPRSLAVIDVDVTQQSPLGIAARGVGKRLVVCDGAQHASAVTVRAVVGTFQLGDALADATLTTLTAPPATFADQTIQIVLR